MSCVCNNPKVRTPTSRCHVPRVQSIDSVKSPRCLKIKKRSLQSMHPDLLDYGPVSFHGDPNSLYDRHLVFDYAIDPDCATPRERYEAVARSLRDVLALRWL